ncbi:YMGG-like glycine zipper-containing protein [Mucilaginibacter lacusdianchii]|uniref:YMGG-like glycine zipper-containing protein n=1 Tax=Mucilaginibacter lacusdianchii TaxID=2684211 RepID=UPI001E55C642|nr:YMGG-like glycine zipper-containing protein [Mucilaginibacter sp. JXJ CY 39]
MKKMIFVWSLIAGFLLTNINVQAQRRPMSSQAKGALIGGAGGALLGAIIGNNVKGALIGAAIGAGGGYIVGNEHRRTVQKRQAAYRQGYSNGYYTRNREVNYRTRYQGYPSYRNVRYANYR